jgi:Holliday junction resolvase
MVALAQLLEAAKIEELAREFRDAGYQVVEQEGGANNGYDLVAIKDDQRIAVEVKARAALRAAAPEIRHLREEAQRTGFSEFRLVVVNPPRERTIEVAGLERALHGFLVGQSPAHIAELATVTTLDRVSVTDLEAIEVTPDGIRVIGSGVLDATLEYDGQGSASGLSMAVEFPLRFDVTLDHALQIVDAREIAVDTDAFAE